MATFKAVVQKKRSDGTYPIYIRVTHNRSLVYLKTDMYVHESKVDGKKEIKDQVVLGRCAIQITEYLRKLNFEDTKNWTVKDVVEFIAEDVKIPFVPFCESFISKMIRNNRIKTAENYENALKSFTKHFGTDITFQDIKSKDIMKWIDTLMNTARAKEMYPSLIKTMFNVGVDEYNDYDNNRIKIANQPFKTVKIPKADVAVQKAVEANVLRKLFDVKPDSKRAEIAQDVAKLIVYLVGINTVDLFNTEKDAYIDGKLCYNRSKTKGGRRDKAYIEIAVRTEIEYLFEKYKGKGNKLFDFGYANRYNFNRNVNIGLEHLCELAGIEKMTSYTFRHSWATIAQNDCGAVTPLISFCLNHTSAYKVTELYIRKRFAPIDELNNKVIDFIFGEKKEGEKPKKRGRKKINKEEVILMNE